MAMPGRGGNGARATGGKVSGGMMQQRQIGFLCRIMGVVSWTCGFSPEYLRCLLEPTAGRVVLFKSKTSHSWPGAPWLPVGTTIPAADDANDVTRLANREP